MAEAVAGTTLFQQVWEGTWLDMEWLAGASGMLRVVATALVLALTLALLGSGARGPNLSLPRVLYAVGMAAMVYIGLHTDRPFLFVAVWTGQHWLAATALATRVGRLPAVPPGCSDRGTRALPGTKPGSDLLASATGCDTTLQRMRR